MRFAMPFPLRLREVAIRREVAGAAVVRAVARAARDARATPTVRISGSGTVSSARGGVSTSPLSRTHRQMPRRNRQCRVPWLVMLMLSRLPFVLPLPTSAASTSVNDGTSMPPVTTEQARRDAVITATPIIEEGDVRVYREPLWSRTYCSRREAMTGPHYVASKAVTDDCANLDDVQCAIAADRAVYTEDVRSGISAVRVVPPVCEPLHESLGVAGPPGMRYSCGYFYDAKGKFTWDKPPGDWPRYAPCGVDAAVESVLEPSGHVLYVYDTRGQGVDIDDRRLGGDAAALFRVINRGATPVEISVRVGADAAHVVELPGLGRPMRQRGHCACPGDVLGALVPRSGLLVHARPLNGSCAYVARHGSRLQFAGPADSFDVVRNGRALASFERWHVGRGRTTVCRGGCCVSFVSPYLGWEFVLCHFCLLMVCALAWPTSYSNKKRVVFVAALVTFVVIALFGLDLECVLFAMLASVLGARYGRLAGVHRTTRTVAYSYTFMALLMVLIFLMVPLPVLSATLRVESHLGMTEFGARGAIDVVFGVAAAVVCVRCSIPVGALLALTYCARPLVATVVLPFNVGECVRTEGYDLCVSEASYDYALSVSSRALECSASSRYDYFCKGGTTPECEPRDDEECWLTDVDPPMSFRDTVINGGSCVHKRGSRRAYYMSVQARDSNLAVYYVRYLTAAARVTFGGYGLDELPPDMPRVSVVGVTASPAEVPVQLWHDERADTWWAPVRPIVPGHGPLACYRDATATVIWDRVAARDLLFALNRVMTWQSPQSYIAAGSQWFRPLLAVVPAGCAPAIVSRAGGLGPVRFLRVSGCTEGLVTVRVEGAGEETIHGRLRELTIGKIVCRTDDVAYDVLVDYVAQPSRVTLRSDGCCSPGATSVVAAGRLHLVCRCVASGRRVRVWSGHVEDTARLA